MPTAKQLKPQRLNKLQVVIAIEVLVILLIVVNIFFDVKLIVKRKPILAKIISSVTLKKADQAAKAQPADATDDAALAAMVLPAEGITLPINWGSLGKKMLDTGVIDQTKFEQLYAQRGGLDDEAKKLLTGSGNTQITMTNANSNLLLNLLWAFGLVNKSPVLEKGPMMDKKYGGAGNFASTGGWTLAKGNSMDYYSKYQLVSLTPAQQSLVENVSKNIYRPCCGNSTYFPDCNHGMAMLGLLELMAANNVSEDQMYKVALQVNAYWFPDTYETIAKYLEKNGKSWQTADAKELLGVDYSSGSGYAKILQQVAPPDRRGGGSCGV